MDAELRQRIQSRINEHPVLLFMKGTRDMPQCGFSATVVQILDSVGGEYETVNVLADQELRQGIKEFSDWPTIPQLYANGEFVGGCDIIKDLFEGGELEPALGLEAQPAPNPSVSVTAAAAKAFGDALDNPEERVRLEIDGDYNHGLSLGPMTERDIVVQAGALELILDRTSARRADGVSIDYVDSPGGMAFKIDNPNQPPGVQGLSVQALKERMDAAPIELFDVRSPQERETAALKGSRLLDKEAQEHIFALAKDTPLYFHCHHGTRSAQAAEFFLKQGYTEVYNVEGGIDAWSQEIDPSVPRY